MKEEYKAYLVSALIGIIAATMGFFILWIGITKGILAVDVQVPAVSVIVLSVILSKKFPIAWEKIRVRLCCVILLLLIYPIFRTC